MCSCVLASAVVSEAAKGRREAMVLPLPLDVPKKEPYPNLPPAKLLDVIEAMCARGFLRQATSLTMTSAEVAIAFPMGTGRQIWEAAKQGNAAALTTYLAYWRGNSESNKVLNYPYYHNTDILSPLGIAVWHNRVACVELLASVSPAVDANKGPVPALCVASRKGFAAAVRILLAVPGILVNKTGAGRCTPLHEASEGGHAEVVRILVGVKDIYLWAQNEKMDTALELAKKGKHQAVIAILEEAIAARKVADDAGMSSPS